MFFYRQINLSKLTILDQELSKMSRIQFSYVLLNKKGLKAEEDHFIKIILTVSKRDRDGVALD